MTAKNSCLAKRFVVGVVGAPFGVQGFVKIRSLSGEYEHLEKLKTASLRRGNQETLWEVEETALVHRTLLMKFKGIDNPEKAKTLRGAELITDRTYAAPLKKGEFYIEDLRDLEVFAESKNVGKGEISLGRISNLIEGGGGFLVEIRLNSGESRLVPFRSEFFGDIILEAGKAILLETWILE